MYKLSHILLEEPILIPRNLEGRKENLIRITNKKIQEYIKNGCKGDLELRHAPITSLPDNLKRVGGELGLSNSAITTLPDNLTVEGNLWTSYTNISEIPKGLKIKENWYLVGSLLADKFTGTELRDLVREKGGYIKGMLRLYNRRLGGWQ